MNAIETMKALKPYDPLTMAGKTTRDKDYIHAALNNEEYTAELFVDDSGRVYAETGHFIANFVSSAPLTPEEKITAALEGLPCLDQRVTVYVPATQNIAAALDNAAVVDAVAQALSVWFGGATIQPGAGCWMSESCGLVTEATTTVYAACTKNQLATHISALRALCENLKSDLGQEAIALEISGRGLYFI